MSIKGAKPFTLGMVGIGSFFGIWAVAAILGGLHSVDWKITSLLHHYFVATGMIKPLHTFVDYYTHIKGIEYLVCVAFFVAFPFFYTYLERRKTDTRKSVESRRR